MARCLTLFTLIGCTRIPQGRYGLDSVGLEGNEVLDDDELEGQIATHETPRFLGLFRGVIYDYTTFNRYVLERDLQRIERYYRARGYYRARARAARVFYVGSHVKVKIIVEEGEPVLLRRIDVHGLEGVPPAIAAEAQAAAAFALPLDEPFEEEAYEQARSSLMRVLANNGYARAKVNTGADVNLPKNAASVGFWVEPGTPAEFGEVTIEGLGPLPENQVRMAIGIRPGDPYSQDDIDEAKRALLDLGVFGSVSIDPQTEKDPKARRVPLHVRVERSKLRSVHLGGGVHVDSQRTEVHVVAGWENANFLGGFRKMLVEVVPGVIVYPTRIPTFEAPERLLPQGRLRSEFRQPGFIEARTHAVVKAQASVYPILLSGDREPSAPIVGYQDIRGSVGLERSHWLLFGAVSHNLQFLNPFTYLGLLDPDLGNIVVSYPEFFGTIDLRDSKVKPHKGAYAAVDAQFAGVGGDAQDVKLNPELRGYLPVARRLTVAARANLGLLFARNYGDTVESNATLGTPGDVSRAAWVRDVQIMFLRGFFAGGSGSNRGYGSREIGPHGVVPFYNPGQTSADFATSCVPGSADYSPAVCDLPLGGFTLWEANLELRYPIFGALTGTLFSDAADVAPRELQFRFDRPHLSVGAGLRYDTPVGPIRFDLGYRLPGLQAPSAPDEGTPSEIFGLPLAVSFGIGESF